MRNTEKGWLSLPLFWLLFMCNCAYPGGATAGVVPHLYDTSLVCQTQANTERQTLFKQGLVEVLERASGIVGIADSAAVKKKIENPSNFVEQYRYEGNTLQVKYSADLVNDLIAQMGHTVWGQRRPNVMVWLAVEQNDKRRIVGAETDLPLQASLKQAATQKGLPLILPLMDIEDASVITLNDVWENAPAILQHAQARYSTETVLVGRLYSDQSDQSEGKPWQADWHLISDRGTHSWTLTGASPEALVAEGVNHATHQLIGVGQQSSASSVPLINSAPFLVSIADIHSGADFNEVEAYLHSIVQVQAVNVSQVLGSLAVFEITPHGENGPQAFERVLSADQHLRPAAPAVNVAQLVDQKIALAYRWAPKPRFVAQEETGDHVSPDFSAGEASEVLEVPDASDASEVSEAPEVPEAPEVDALDENNTDEE